MKKIFEEYGFIILTCVVVIALVGITIGVKPLMADSLSDITNTWGLKAQELVKNSWDNIINNNQSDETGTVESGILSIDLIENKLGNYTYQGSSDGGTYLYIKYNENKLVLENSDGSLYSNTQLENAARSGEQICRVGTIKASPVGMTTSGLYDITKSGSISGFCENGEFMFDETDTNYIYMLDDDCKYFSYTKDSNGNLTNLTMYHILKREKADYTDMSPDICTTISGDFEMSSVDGVNGGDGSYIEISLSSYGITFNTDEVKIGQDVSSWFIETDDNSDYVRFYTDNGENFNKDSLFKECTFEVTKVEGNKVTVLVGGDCPGLDPIDGDITEGYIYAIIPSECVYYGNKLYSELECGDYILTIFNSDEDRSTAKYKHS